MTLDRKCERCGQTYDPKMYWTICPHNPLVAETAPLPARTGDVGGWNLPRSPLTPDDYQRLAARTICDQNAALSRLSFPPYSGEINPTQLLHSLVGLIGEAGEIATEVQRKYWYGKAISEEEFRLKMADEFGDLLWYVMEGLSALGLDVGKVMEANIAKLRARYPDKYTDTLAAEENRDRAAEAKAVQATIEKAPPPRTPRIEQDGHGFGHVVVKEDCVHSMVAINETKHRCIKCGLTEEMD